MSSVIKVESLAKRYLLRHQNAERYLTFRSVVTNGARNLGRRLLHPSRSAASKREEFWALKDVSLEINQGDRVGIIGRNGAGKSTLLKILSRITEPTSGRVSIKGRLASLLEVGTGFHPELTGRENIFLNGAILGMSKGEIRKKFDEIVAFSEIEKFLDTPVKRYSSGMYVRLAFAVAAHLEPEILIVDEVLAVGDVQFQKKCLGKMEEVGKDGRTILFVSHNMAVINKVCSKGVLLDAGMQVANGSMTQVVENYIRRDEVVMDQAVRVVTDVSCGGRNDVTIDRIVVTRLDGEEIGKLSHGESIRLRVDYNANKRLISPALIVSCKTKLGIEIFRLSTMPISGYSIKEIAGRGFFELIVKDIPLVGGTYFLDISLARGGVERYLTIENAVQLNVEATDVYGSGLELDSSRGLIAISHQWHHETLMD